ncbi:MAG: hypothetical protein R2698_00920 [Microthrixaceae bacterium]
MSTFDTSRRCPTGRSGRRRVRRCDESGQAAGLETVPMGVLVFVTGVLLAVNAWAVVDTRTGLDSAAYSYLRAYTAASTRGEAVAAGIAAATASMGGRTATTRLRIEAPAEPFGPCLPATVTLRMTVPAVRVPFLGTLGETTVTATETDMVQPYGRARPDQPEQESPCPR